MTTDPSGIESNRAYEILCLMLLMAMLLAGLAMLLHIVAFHIAVGTHRWLGRPRYWNSTAPKLDKRDLLVQTARRTWWVIPLGITVSTIFDKVGWTLSYVQFLIISRESWTTFTLIAALAFVVFIFCSRAISQAIRRNISDEDLICSKCGYRLLGIRTDRCPECALLKRPAEYGLCRPGTRSSRRLTAFAAIILIAALILAPAWVPSAHAKLWEATLTHFPVFSRRYIRYFPVPQTMQIYGPDAYPIRSDKGYVIIRRGTSAGRIRFFMKGPVAGHYEAEFWANAAKMDISPADSKTAGFTNPVETSSIKLGPWNIKTFAAYNFVIWLKVPDPSYQLTAGQ